ncbi:MAG TPA: sugar ABC transporter permease [Mycobacteriales bacterium]|jgi:multiple sugar transport system permease protein
MATTAAPPAEPAAPPVAPGPDHGRRRGVGRLAALLVSPTFLVLGLVVAYPLLDALRLSFFRRNEGVNPQTGMLEQGDRFVGLANYTTLFSDEAFLKAFRNTTTLTVSSVVIETVLGVAMALIMNKALAGRAFIRASILIPWAIPTAISALLWRWVYQADGAANALLGTDILWTAEGLQAWFAVVVADTWKTAPFIGLLVLAGLQIIPAEVYEAAKVDGASAWSTFWRITLPLVRPALIVAVLFRLLDVLRMFDLPYVMIGPGKQPVETLSVLAFQEAIQYTRFGPAAAMSTLLFLYIAVVAFVFVRVLGADIVGARVGRK